jgi:clan AA aspartic protease (TIGR02281 family)
MHPHPWIAVALALALADPAGAGEIYRWIDASGVEHFSHEIGKVPPAYRDAAIERSRSEAPSRLQTFGEGSGREPLFAPPPAAIAPARSLSAAEVRIPFVPYGTLMMVQVRLNDSLEAPFLIDTGASGIAITRDAARALGITIDRRTPRVEVATASGVVSEPRVGLASVQLGGARVENLEALVSSTMEIGLLGGTFFNNFVYQVDAGAGVITLRPNDRVRGGLSEGQWRERFGMARAEIDRLVQYMETHEEDHRLGRILEGLRSELDALEREASLAGVPPSWRY